MSGVLCPAIAAPRRPLLSASFQGNMSNMDLFCSGGVGRLLLRQPWIIEISTWSPPTRTLTHLVHATLVLVLQGIFRRATCSRSPAVCKNRNICSGSISGSASSGPSVSHLQRSFWSNRGVPLRRARTVQHETLRLRCSRLVLMCFASLQTLFSPPLRSVSLCPTARARRLRTWPTRSARRICRSCWKGLVDGTFLRRVLDDHVMMDSSKKLTFCWRCLSVSLAHVDRESTADARVGQALGGVFRWIP